jgi:hypothetical protein
LWMMAGDVRFGPICGQIQAGRPVREQPLEARARRRSEDGYCVGSFALAGPVLFTWMLPESSRK